MKVTVISVDLDIDSDNTNGRGAPDRNMAEDSIEDQAGLFQKIIPVNFDNDESDDATYFLSETVHDRIDDVGDGFNLDGGVDVQDDDNDSEDDFIPIILEIPDPIDLTKAKVRFTYAGSYPGSVSWTDAAPNYEAPNRRRIQVPADLPLRLWRIEGDSNERDGNTVENGGDYLESGVAYAIDDLRSDGGTAQRVNQLYLEALLPSSTEGDERILVEIDPDGDGPNGFMCRDAVRVRAVQVTPTEAALYSGFDSTVNPPALVLLLPAGISSYCVLSHQGGIPVKGRSTDSNIATLVNEGPYQSLEQIEIQSAGTAEAAVIEFFADTPDQIVLAKLRVRALPAKSIQTIFHHVRDQGADPGDPSDDHFSVLTEADAQEGLDRMNEIWGPQANIIFEPSDVDFRDNDPIIAQDLGCVIQWYNGESGIVEDPLRVPRQPGELHIFLCWQVEIDDPPDEACADSQAQAFADLGTPIHADDDTANPRGEVYAHEVGHHLSNGIHFHHEIPPDPNGDWNIWHNLMNPESSSGDTHLTIRQAIIANTAVTSE